MRVVVDDSPELRAEALEDELHSALLKLSQVLVQGKDPNEAAWWLCANHARFVLNHPNMFTPAAMQKLMGMAAEAGTPPSGTTSWPQWFDRVQYGYPVKL